MQFYLTSHLDIRGQEPLTIKHVLNGILAL